MRIDSGFHPKSLLLTSLLVLLLGCNSWLRPKYDLNDFATIQKSECLSQLSGYKLSKRGEYVVLNFVGLNLILSKNDSINWYIRDAIFHGAGSIVPVSLSELSVIAGCFSSLKVKSVRSIENSGFISICKNDKEVYYHIINEQIVEPNIMDWFESKCLQLDSNFYYFGKRELYERTLGKN